MQPDDVTPRPIIIKLENGSYLFDRWRDWLTDAGFHILRARNYTDALRLARRTAPVLILVADDPRRGIDAVEWLEMQHSDVAPHLPMTPLLMIAHSQNAMELRLQELPDRVLLLLRPIDEEKLLAGVRTLLGG